VERLEAVLIFGSVLLHFLVTQFFLTLPFIICFFSFTFIQDILVIKAIVHVLDSQRFVLCSGMDFPLCLHVLPVLGPTQFPVQWIPKALSLEVKAAGE
jgi:hypothetical protein